MTENKVQFELKNEGGNPLETIPIPVLDSQPALALTQDRAPLVAVKNSRIFPIAYYGFACLSIYFLLIGLPLWDGLVLIMW